MKPFLRRGGLAALVLAMSQAGLAQAPAPTPRAAPAASAPAASEAPAQPSELSAELFYQLLLGELSAGSADPGTGFALMLDAARKTNDEALYKRAVEMAFQGRAGDAALQAARAWREAFPASRDANRFVLQILLALNRVAETVEPLRNEIALSPAPERPAVLALVPRLFARASDKKLAATVAEQALAEPLTQPATSGPAWTAIGRLRMAAGDKPGAVEAARRAHAAAPTTEGPALLALELIEPGQPQAEAIVRRYLAGKPLPELRMAFARALLDAQRYAEASEQLRLVTSEKPEFVEAWLVQGVLQAQDNQLPAAETSLKKYVELAQAQRGDEDRSRGLAQAYLALSQIAEKRNDLPLATAWLDKIEDAQDLVSAQTRRASILARQGKLEEGRKLLRALPDRNPGDARMKLMAEVQLLRDNKQYKTAYDLLGQAAAKDPADAELVYDQAMMAEKLNNVPDMERLLRLAIARKPDFHHAYNALGYSLAERGLRLPEAKQLIQKALEFAPGDPFITDSLAWVEFRMGNKTEALRLLDQAFKSRPDAEIAAHLGEVLWSVGQRDRAQAVWKEGLLLNSENETLLEALKRFKIQP
ncbi:MAG TPA: tetratricopeptide repeat protein [Ramlibacter sp.]|nr:tetratricopeptide repeat protein [Ramlibacter sp.]